MSEHFQNQLKFFGMAPSFAFVREPETNGVAERFIRTLKEQIVFGRIYQNIEEVRAAVGHYFERYNRTGYWKRTAYRSPAETRRPGWQERSERPHNAALCPKNRVRYSHADVSEASHCWLPSDLMIKPACGVPCP